MAARCIIKHALHQLKKEKKLTPSCYNTLAIPILKMMGVNPKNIEIHYGTPKKLGLRHGYTGNVYVQNKGENPAIAVATTYHPHEVLRTIPHEIKHAIDRGAQRKHVPAKAAEEKAYAFEGRFVQEFNNQYGIKLKCSSKKRYFKRFHSKSK